MSFRCDVCDEAQPAGTKPNRIVLEYRQKTYYLKDDKVSRGSEIVEEADACEDCATHREHMLKGGHAVG